MSGGKITGCREKIGKGVEMNIIDLADIAGEIMASQKIFCPECQQKQFSPFDKLFTKAYDKCVDCTPAGELDDLSENIFAIIEAV